MEENKRLKILTIIFALILPLAIIVTLLLAVRFYPQLADRLPAAIVGVSDTDDRTDDSDDSDPDPDEEPNCEECPEGTVEIPALPEAFEIVREPVQDGTIYLYYNGSGTFGDRGHFFITYPEFRTEARIVECYEEFPVLAFGDIDCANNIGQYLVSYPATQSTQQSFAHYKWQFGNGIGFTDEVSSYIRLTRPSDEIISRIRAGASVSLALNAENTKLYMVIQDYDGSAGFNASDVYEYDLATGSETFMLSIDLEDAENGREYVYRVDGKYLTIGGHVCFACDAPQMFAFVVDTEDNSLVNLGTVGDLKIYPQSGHATFLDDEGVYRLESL